MFKYSQIVNCRPLAHDPNRPTMKSEKGEAFMSGNFLIEKYELMENHSDGRKLKTAAKCKFEVE